MKKLRPLITLPILFAFQFCFSQENSIPKDTIGLHEVIIPKEVSRKEMKTILKKIKYNLNNNYYQGFKNYQTNHLSVKNDKDTLVNQKTVNNLDLRILSQSNLEQLLLNSPNNPFKTNTSLYSRFQTNNINSNYWLALSIFYDSLHVLNFDFFDLSWNYKYKIIKVGNITTVSFTASKYFSGNFSFNNTNYNLIQIDFKNTSPYYYNQYGLQNNSSEIEFESHWIYNNVSFLLDFKETPEGKLILAKLDAMQELTQFEFKRYLPQPKRVIDQDKNIKFYTILNMKILE
jgi:hypothetical protein